MRQPDCFIMGGGVLVVVWLVRRKTGTLFSGSRIAIRSEDVRRHDCCCENNAGCLLDRH